MGLTNAIPTGTLPGNEKLTAVSTLMSMWLYYPNPARFPSLMIPIVFNGDRLNAGLYGISPCTVLHTSVTSRFEPHKEDIRTLWSACAWALTCAIRALLCVAVCLMGASGWRERVEPWLITERGRGRNVQKLCPSRTVLDETVLQSWRE
jgi:hypothetical protein